MLAILYTLGLVVTFYALAKLCDQYFVKSLDIISKKLKLSEDVAGATFMAVGSSAPEFFTAVIAVFSISTSDIGAGTIVGSAIFNILIIIGASAIAATAYLKWQPVIRDMLFYILSIIILLVTFMDGRITWMEALLYVIVYVAYIGILAQWNRIVPAPVETQLSDIVDTLEEEEEEVKTKVLPLWSQFVWIVDRVFGLFFSDLSKHPEKYWRVFFMSLAFMIVLAWALVEMAVGLSHQIGLPEVIIALTVLAAGTSLPDLLASLIVARQGRGDMAVSNAVGSNIFDILICLGLPWLGYILVTGNEVTVGTDNLLSSIFLLFGTVIAIFAILIAKHFKIGRYSGYGLIGLYGLYVVYMVVNSYYPGTIELDAWISGFFQ